MYKTRYLELNDHQNETINIARRTYRAAALWLDDHHPDALTEADRIDQ